MAEWTDVVRLKDRTNSQECPTNPLSSVSQSVEPAQPKPPGGSIPGYEILEELGRGGMGVVYKALQVRLNRLVALKVVIGGAFAGPVEKARFQMEAEAVARLHHKNIVQVFDIGKHNDVEYIAFEYVEGPTIRRWQNWQPIDPRTAAGIAVDVARAVQHAHDRGIIHRDLKPANILLAGVGIEEKFGETGGDLTVPDFRAAARVPKVMDFGLAKSVEGGSNLTLSGVACGTPNYMAPEQVKGGPNAAKPSVDVWGLGAVLFEMLTGRPPFSGWDAATIMQEILLSEAPSVRKFTPGVPRDLAVLVSKCLEKDPNRRYLSPGDMADELDRFLAGQPILARAIGPVQRIKRWLFRNPIASALGAVMLLGLALDTSLTVVFNQMADRERDATERERLALAEEAKLRQEAEYATRAAEKARDDTRTALTSAETALGKARDERDRAEKNLTMARKAVSHVLATISSHNENENPALVPVYHHLLTDFEPFVDQMLAQRKGDRDLRFDQALIARGRGFMEVTSGKVAMAREHLLAATGHFGELVREKPTDREARRELCYTLACLGAISMELGLPDADSLLQETQKSLEGYIAAYPGDLLALDSMIRVRLSMAASPGNHFADEHNRAVLDLVDQLASMGQLTPHFLTSRAHALNNIASGLTNRDKTDEAEKYWLEVMALREDLAHKSPNDKIMKYELAKCLLNYSNQLIKTDRSEQSFKLKGRAADLFDTLHEDARFRATYVPLMVESDYKLANEYAARGDIAKAITRLNKAIALNGILLERDNMAMRVRAWHADTHTRRAELNDLSGQHNQAARDYRKAIEFSTMQPHGEYCTARLIQALVRSGDRITATAMAKDLNPDNLCHPALCLELARSWLVIFRASGKAPDLNSTERDQASKSALENARKAVQTAQKKGIFKDPKQVRKFHGDQDFEPLWDLVARLPE
ncbi:MAG TPA: protein kinase [Gemmata sp.]|jgi:serine/threonine protein kinase|nr:protein kinase [Gemmata sp.]